MALGNRGRLLFGPLLVCLTPQPLNSPPMETEANGATKARSGGQSPHPLPVTMDNVCKMRGCMAADQTGAACVGSCWIDAGPQLETRCRELANNRPSITRRPRFPRRYVFAYSTKTGPAR